MPLWYRGTKPASDQNISKQLTELGKKHPDTPGRVRTIHLTDDGELADHGEFTDAIYAIRNVDGPELVIWYVHGWKHNARSRDFRRFEELVDVLHQPESERPEDERRHVMGVYVAWDGAKGLGGVFQNLTFWGRKRAADRISQSAIVTKIVSAARHARGQRPHSDDLTVMIGHSFGARILYSATIQVLIDDVQRQHPGEDNWGYGVISGPADMILLLNPAFEASMFTAIDSIRRPGKESECFHREQPPLLVAIATTSDRATRWAFPFGQLLGRAWRLRQRTTLGNYDEYATHELTRETDSNEAASSEHWFDAFQGSKLRLQRRPTAISQEQGDPFVVATTTSVVMKGHNGIWGDDLRTWVTEFLAALQQHATEPKSCLTCGQPLLRERGRR